ncbi:uncharacterized protein BT62DRAFT_1009314 [Guyanagaster necrorhizus]|uniref:Uncharacterized protein n=1 Tax=Guyanagaster necrorhizus TaxID=856835 RepID=A0A9P7VP76_9AGAR|nr:uncharacterized protein BT62DRAFT_1009314 [Guyanagaster necrorhizus MCA 3950]KAG7443501.1 hypothetical protein BT62DRAFT_1009314 [Guyanagaster necrorhizus MCA 3950]
MKWLPPEQASRREERFVIHGYREGATRFHDALRGTHSRKRIRVNSAIENALSVHVLLSTETELSEIQHMKAYAGELRLENGNWKTSFGVAMGVAYMQYRTPTFNEVPRPAIQRKISQPIARKRDKGPGKSRHRSPPSVLFVLGTSFRGHLSIHEHVHSSKASMELSTGRRMSTDASRRMGSVEERKCRRPQVLTPTNNAPPRGQVTRRPDLSADFSLHRTRNGSNRSYGPKNETESISQPTSAVMYRMENMLLRLGHVSIDAFTIQVMVATAQRFWVVAPLDYMDLYKPIMDSNLRVTLVCVASDLWAPLQPMLTSLKCFGVPAFPSILEFNA